MSLNQKNINRQDFWEDQIKIWKESGLSQSEHCRKYNINKQLFSKWKTRLLKAKENKLVQIPIKLKNDFLKCDDFELIIKDQYKIKIHSGFNPETLKRLIKLIED